MLFCNSVKISSTIFLYVIQQSPQSIKSIINCGETYFYCIVKCFLMIKLKTLSAHPRGAFLISRNELSHVSVTRSFLDIKNSACQRTHFGKNFLRNSCLTTTTLQQFPITKQKSTSRLSVLRHSSLFIYFKFLFGTKHYHSPAVQNKTSP